MSNPVYISPACMREAQLLPCPFCGGDDLTVFKELTDGGRHVRSVGCNRCDFVCKFPVKWNTRAALQQKDDEIARLTGCCEGYGNDASRFARERDQLRSLAIELRDALQKVIEEDVQQVEDKWSKCPHGLYNSQGCEACVSDFLMPFLTKANTILGKK